MTIIRFSSFLPNSQKWGKCQNSKKLSFSKNGKIAKIAKIGKIGKMGKMGKMGGSAKIPKLTKFPKMGFLGKYPKIEILAIAVANTPGRLDVIIIFKTTPDTHSTYFY